MFLIKLYLHRSYLLVTAAVLFGAVSGLCAAVLLAVVNTALESGWAAPTVAVFTGLCVVRLLSGVGSHMLMVRLAQGTICRMRMEMSRQILRSPLPHLEGLGNHRLMASFTGDIASVARVAINIPYFLVNLVVLVGCLIYLGWMSLGVVVGVAACFIVGVMSYLGPVLWANRRLRVAREYEDALHDGFQGVVQGAKEMKLHQGRQALFLERCVHSAADHVRKHNVAGITVYAAAANWNRLLFFVYVGLLVFALPESEGTNAVRTAGYVLVVLYMMAPLEAIMNALPHLAQANVALRKIQELGLSLQSSGTELVPQEIPPAVSDGWQALCLRGAVYRHSVVSGADEPVFVLGPIDLILRRGEVVYLTGGNGSGKTTLAKVLVGLYPLVEGALEVDEAAVSDEDLPVYRQRFSAVLSDYHLFEDLIAKDVAQLDGRAQEYLQWLQLEGKLSIRNGKMSTTRLSQGQRKRLALLSALLEDRPVYVLDEWAADQEPAFRDCFYRQIIPELRRQGKTVIVITHDDRYFHLAERLIELKDGQVVRDSRPNTAESCSG